MTDEDVSIEDILSIGSILVGVQLIASVVAVFTPSPSALFRSCVQHLSAGVITAAVAVELLPLLLNLFTPVVINYVVVIFPFICVVVIFSVVIPGSSSQTPASDDIELQELSSSESPSAEPLAHESPPPQQPAALAGMLALVALGVFLDGVLYALSYVLNTTTGLVVSIAFALETGVLGLLTSTTLRGMGMARWKIVGAVVGFTLLTFAGIVLGGGIFSKDRLLLSLFCLALGSAAFLYLTIDSLLIEARQEEVSNPRRARFCFYLGFAAIFFLDLALR